MRHQRWGELVRLCQLLPKSESTATCFREVLNAVWRGMVNSLFLYTRPYRLQKAVQSEAWESFWRCDWAQRKRSTHSVYMNTGRGGQSKHLPNLRKLKQCHWGDGVAHLSSTSKNFVASLSHLALCIYTCIHIMHICIYIFVYVYILYVYLHVYNCIDIATDLWCILRIWGLSSLKSAQQASRPEMQGRIYVGTQVWRPSRAEFLTPWGNFNILFLTPSTDWIRPTNMEGGSALFKVYWIKC